ncbi:hypothetical protein C2G38_2213543 [Gigaspora rosea]|uniref:Uncharacterized protein n=1 Tax=Gigaspora rosea TaxID=44941 RepID=A0A397UDP3_9GLOM|nr:hypothetical protein C2G38_2213543 [Gigaspora rosea]
MKTIVEKVKHGRSPKSSKPQETVAKSSSKIQAKVSKSSSKTKPVLKVSKSLQKNASKSSQNKSFRKSSYYYEDEGEDADEDEYKDVNELNPNQRNIQNDDNDDNNDALPLSKSSKSQNQKNVTFEDNMDNSSTSHTAANILEMISEDNNEDNDNNDDRQHNDIHTLDVDTYSISGNDNEEFQLANSLTAISSNEYDREVQSDISEKSKGKLREHEASQIPAEFDGMNNILEICNWLSKISPATCIDEFVKKIFGYPPYSKEGTEIRTKTKNTLSDFQHRLNQSVLGHVKNYKAIQERQGAASLTKENINNYINEKVTMDVLNRFIGGTNQRELQKCGAVKKLVQLIREMFKIHWQDKNIDQVKNLDNLTKNMHVLLRSGLDIASKLNFN